ncbi:MAG: histidine phosphatase family protein [Polyangiales bacterium]
MKLYVMRHGPAEDDSPTGEDATRALTPSGRERVRAVTRALVAAGEAPKLVVASPLVRALQTAEIVHAHGEVEAPVQVHGAIAPRGEALAFVRRAAKDGKKRLMVVGHEPDVSILVAALLGRSLAAPFAKAMVVGLRVPPDEGDATLRFVLDPRSLELVTDVATVE